MDRGSRRLRPNRQRAGRRSPNRAADWGRSRRGGGLNSSGPSSRNTVRMDRPYRCAYAGAHRLKSQIGVRSRFHGRPAASSFAGFSIRWTNHQHSAPPPNVLNRTREINARRSDSVAEGRRRYDLVEVLQSRHCRRQGVAADFQGWLRHRFDHEHGSLPPRQCGGIDLHFCSNKYVVSIKRYETKFHV